jgi:hypothetical protein
MPSSGHVEHQSLPLDVSPETRIRWLESRTAALERQLEYRIQQAMARDDLSRLLIDKAKQYDELMQTRTMRILRRPRAAYTWLRRLNRDRHG